MKEFNFSKVADLKRATLMKNWTLLQVFFDRIFWLVLAQLQSSFFIEHLPVAVYVRCLKEKEERNEIVCFYCTQSDIFLCGIARFSQENKNKLRTFEPQKWKRIKEQPASNKIYRFLYKKECIYFWLLFFFIWLKISMHSGYWSK